MAIWVLPVRSMTTTDSNTISIATCINVERDFVNIAIPPEKSSEALLKACLPLADFLLLRQHPLPMRSNPFKGSSHGFAVGPAPLEPHHDVPPDAKVADTHIQVSLGLVRRADLAAGGNAHLQCGLEDPLLNVLDFWACPLPGTPHADAVIGRPPLDHVETGQTQDLLELLDRPLLLDHQDDDGVANGLDVIPLHLCVRPAAVLEGLPPHLGAVDPSVFRRLRAGRPDARSGVGRTPAICEQHALKARADAALRKERPGLLVDLDHGREVPQLGRPADVLEPGKIEGPVFRDEFDVIKHAALPNEFDHRGPGVQQVGPQCGPACFQQLTKLVAPHCGSPSSSSSSTCSTPRPIERNLQSDRSLP